MVGFSSPLVKLAVNPEIAERNARRVLSRFTSGAPSWTTSSIVRQEVGWPQTLGSAGASEPRHPSGVIQKAFIRRDEKCLLPLAGPNNPPCPVKNEGYFFYLFV
jgi:hypothetical protein